MSLFAFISLIFLLLLFHVCGRSRDSDADVVSLDDVSMFNQGQTDDSKALSPLLSVYQDFTGQRSMEEQEEPYILASSKVSLFCLSEVCVIVLKR